MPTAAVSPASSLHYVGFSKQASKGTAVTPAYFAAFVDSPSYAHNMSTRQVREAGGGVYVARSLKDVHAPAISFACPARPDIAGALWALFLGDDTISGAGDPYTHTIAPSETVLWTTFERNINDELVERITDGVISEMVLDVRKRDTGPEVMLSANAFGLTPTREASASTDAYETGRPYLRSDGSWLIDNAAATNVERATVTCSWNYDEAIFSDSLERFDAAKLTLDVQVEVTQLFNSSAELNAYIATYYGTTSGTTSSETVYQPSATNSFDLDLTYTDGQTRQMQVNLPKVSWESASIDEPNPAASEAIRLTRSGHLVDGSGMSVVVQNSVATAYDA